MDIHSLAIEIVLDGKVIARAHRPVICGKGTFNGGAATVSKFGFAVCVLSPQHAPPCDSGPSDEPEPPQRAA